MSGYTPDNWVVIKFKGDDPHYRILAGWSGGYTTGDYWRMNSGITELSYDDRFYSFKGSSGSVYLCHKDSYCLRKNSVSAWHELQDKYGNDVELMPKDTDWMGIDWLIK